MSERMDVVCAQKRGEKTYWNRIGSAWPAKSGTGYNVVLFAVPASQEGEYRFSIFPVDAERATKAAPSGPAKLDDDIPF